MSRHEPPAYPRHSWYVAATSDEVTARPLGRRALDTSIVLYRPAGGAVAVLEDRDAHRPYPLSLGRVEDDLIVSSYSGFAYRPDGVCVRVPTQAEVPYGARVRSFPVVEQDGLVWVWFAEPGLAGSRRPPAVPWLGGAGWSTFGDQWDTAANFVLLHENFADITHMSVVDPELAPPVLTSGPVPVLEVEISETQVSLHRDFPPAPLAPWHAALVGAAPETTFDQRERGRFVSPGMWINSWQAAPSAGGAALTFHFAHAITPLDSTSTRHVWRVGRDFAHGDAATEELEQRFSRYYRSVRDILQTMQEVLLRDGPRGDVGVVADAAALQVRKIVYRMAAEQRLS